MKYQLLFDDFSQGGMEPPYSFLKSFRWQATLASSVFYNIGSKSSQFYEFGVNVGVGLGSFNSGSLTTIPTGIFLFFFTFFLELLLSRSSEPTHFKSWLSHAIFKIHTGFVFGHFYITIYTLGHS